MNCWHCGCELIWQNDYSYEDYYMEGEGIVTNLCCSNEDCNAFCEVYLDINNGEGDE